VNKIPNTQLVVAAWINSISDLRPGCAAAELPTDNATWGTSGFAVVTVVGGNHHVFSGQVNHPVVQIDCFAMKPETGRPLWGAANAMLSTISAACDAKATLQRALALPHSFGQARVLSAYQLSEERRIYRDNISAAIVQADFHFYWREG
jgi:hypothetical protein